MAALWFSANMGPMNQPDVSPNKEAPNSKPSRSEEVLRVIEEYANGLREIIKKLRKHLN
jgi:hypothetical protein